MFGRILVSQLNVLRVSSRLSTVLLPARSTSAFKFRSFHATPVSRDIDGAPKPDADGNKVIYIGPANGNIRFIKRLAAATVFCFSVAYPVAAIGLNLGTATLGLGSRLLFSAVGSIFSIGLTSVLHKYTKGYVVSISTNPKRPFIWRAQVYSLIGGVKEIDIDTRTIKTSPSKSFQFVDEKGTNYFVLFALFEDKKQWIDLGLPLSGDDVIVAKESGVHVDEKKILDELAQRDTRVFKQ